MERIDLLKHCIAGTILGAVIITFFNKAIWFDALGQYNAFVGFGFTVLLLIAYEYYQKWFNKGQHDWADVLAGAIGAAIVLTVVLANRCM